MIIKKSSYDFIFVILGYDFVSKKFVSWPTNVLFSKFTSGKSLYTDINAFNYDSLANIDDGSCEEIVFACLDSIACNFDESVLAQYFTPSVALRLKDDPAALL